MLRKAIEENWPEPVTENVRALTLANGLGARFAAYFYAGYASSKHEPTAEPSANDAQTAERYVRRLLEVWPDETQVKTWGRQFGEFVRERQRGNEKVINSLVFSLRSFGDEFYSQHQARRARALTERQHEAEEAHSARFELAWFKYLRAQEVQFKKTRPADYANFKADRQKRQKALATNRWELARKERLAAFDTEQKRLEDFQAFFADDVLDFWDWDEQRNPQRFIKEAVTL